ncbi:N-acetylglucosamine kinase [Paenibacillus ginsengarvi]|uniref:ATPase n=1 Tax=Paenibacillus ginsengarvi TaxID=400777 RepID=A0A3B0CK91_9BACL|nr:BadF/BadG/BcrA/BcrD ATPase family protein [Paenibacillus ginsengarvi]RKN85118.1 ATPase [Paenibacillus ginsengarvi]
MPEQDVVLGIDGGGSYTRVMVSDLQGRILSYAEGGASSIHKDSNAAENVRSAIRSALANAGCRPGEVKGLCAGVAGYDSERDLEWVEALTDVEGLESPKWHVNDAVIAHAGAFLGEPGIVVVSGTGSILFAITEDGTRRRNYDFHHYAASAARFLSYDAVFEMLAGHARESDEFLMRDVLRYWNAGDMEHFRSIAAGGFVEDRQERNKRFGLMAPIVTEAAKGGSRLARLVCDRAIDQIVVGVEMLGSCFQSDRVAVAGIGSVINSPYMKSELAAKLEHGQNKQYRLADAALSAVSGAVVMALKHVRAPIGPETFREIGKHPRSAY